MRLIGISVRRTPPMVLAALAFLSLACTPGGGTPPTDAEILAAIRKSPPPPPTIGPTRLVQVDTAVPIQRGAYNADGKYWPIRIKLNGLMQLSGSMGILYLSLPESARKPNPVEFVTEARLARNDYGEWVAQYLPADGPPRTE